MVLEDSPAGVASGEAAGCAVVAVSSVAGVVFMSEERRLVVDSLERVRLEDLSMIGTPAG